MLFGTGLAIFDEQVISVVAIQIPGLLMIQSFIANIEPPVSTDLKEFRVTQDREDFCISDRVNAVQELASRAFPDQFRVRIG